MIIHKVDNEDEKVVFSVEKKDSSYNMKILTNNKPVGVFGFGEIDNIPNYLNVDHRRVWTNFQGRGIARLAFEVIEEIAKENKRAGLCLNLTHEEVEYRPDGSSISTIQHDTYGLVKRLGFSPRDIGSRKLIDQFEKNPEFFLFRNNQVIRKDYKNFEDVWMYKEIR